MPCIELRTSSLYESNSTCPQGPLPQLLQTPSGLAIVEIQGTIHGPHTLAPDSEPSDSTVTTALGQLEFPLYNVEDCAEGRWMKKVYLYIGKHQRLTGEVKKLARPLGVIRKATIREYDDPDAQSAEIPTEDLELVEIVKYKMMFSARPEPVSE